MLRWRKYERVTTRRSRALNLMLFGALLAGCKDATQSQPAKETTWQPSWKTTPDKNKPPKVQLRPTVAFDDEWLGGIPVLGTDEQKRAHDEDIRQKEQFIDAFRHMPECKGVAFARTKPASADFDMQLFNGLDGRAGRWQWVIYRTDTDERISFGEETDLDEVAKNVCTTIHKRVDLAGGKVE